MSIYRLLSTLFSIILLFVISATAQTTKLSVAVKTGDKNLEGSAFTFVGQVSTTSKGDIAFLGTAPSGSVLKGAVYLKPAPVDSNTALKLLLSMDEQLPVPGTIGTVTSPKVNDLGDVAFASLLREQTLPGGLFIKTDGVIKKVVIEGDLSPLGPKFTSLFSRSPAFAINNRREVVFISAIVDTPPKVGVFVYHDDLIKKIFLDGDILPNGGKFKTGPDSLPVINNNGELLINATSIDPVTNQASSIILVSDQTTNKIVVAVGDPAPEGGTFTLIQNRGRYINDRGEVMFLGQANDKMSLYLAKPDGDKFNITRIVGVGDSSADGGTFRNLAAALLPASGGINNNGVMLFRAETTKTTDGLFIFANGAVQKITGKNEATPLGGLFPIDAGFNSAFLGPILADTNPENIVAVFESTIQNGPDGPGARALFLWTPVARTAPKVLGAIYDKKNKVLNITATFLAADTKIEINNKPITIPTKIVSPNQLTLAGKRKALKLNKGENTNGVVIISGDGLRSQKFVF